MNLGGNSLTLFLRPPKPIPVGPRAPVLTAYLRVPNLFSVTRKSCEIIRVEGYRRGGRRL